MFTFINLKTKILSRYFTPKMNNTFHYLCKNSKCEIILLIACLKEKYAQNINTYLIYFCN